LAFALCERLGFPHPRYLLPLLTPQDLIDWQARWELQPWGELRQDLRNAVTIAYLLAPYQDATADAPPEILWPYFRDNEPAVDFDATADALSEHLERCYADLKKLTHGPQNDRQPEHSSGRLDGDPEP
jgi:hypothetical protein